MGLGMYDNRLSLSLSLSRILLNEGEALSTGRTDGSCAACEPLIPSMHTRGSGGRLFSVFFLLAEQVSQTQYTH